MRKATDRKGHVASPALIALAFGSETSEGNIFPLI